MAMPTFVSKGTKGEGTGAVAYSLPASIATNDVLLLCIESNGTTGGITNQNGGAWAEVTGSPVTVSTTASISVFWDRYNGTQGNPTVGAASSQQVGSITAYRGVKTSGNPWNVVGTSTDAVGDSSPVIGGATTTSNDCLVVIAFAAHDDNVTISSITNADLASITVRSDDQTSAGNDGAAFVYTGQKATAGAFGNTDVAWNAGFHCAAMVIALEGVSAGAASPRVNSQFLKSRLRGLI